MINYVVGEYTDQDKTVTVTYINEEQLTYTRTVNIPRLEDGSVDEEYFQEILDGQLRGVENKLKIGLIDFQTSEEEQVAPLSE
jgi:hypothetical protein